MKNLPLMTIVSGLPAAGKTHLAEAVAQALRLPCFSRDGINEVLFDGLSLAKEQWSGTHRKTSYELLYWIMAKMLEAGQSFIVESSFDQDTATKRIAHLAQQYHFRILQIVVTAQPEILLQRYNNRLANPAASNKAHAVHFAYLTYDKYKAKLAAGRWATQPLAIADEVWEVDTTDTAKLDYTDLIRKISAKVAADISP